MLTHVDVSDHALKSTESLLKLTQSGKCFQETFATRNFHGKNSKFQLRGYSTEMTDLVDVC